jgi:hypothetical protein
MPAWSTLAAASFSAVSGGTEHHGYEYVNTRGSAAQAEERQPRALSDSVDRIFDLGRTDQTALGDEQAPVQP